MMRAGGDLRVLEPVGNYYFSASQRIGIGFAKSLGGSVTKRTGTELTKRVRIAVTKRLGIGVPERFGRTVTHALRVCLAHQI